MKIKGLKSLLGGNKTKPDVHLSLHIGMPKTGTTALQHFLDHNRQVLYEEFGMYYPACGIPSFQHVSFVKSIVKKKYPWAYFSDVIDEFDPLSYLGEVLDQCRLKKCKKVVLSSEFFWGAPVTQGEHSYHTINNRNFDYMDSFVEHLSNLFRIFKSVDIIVFLRRQDHWIESFYNQQVKNGFKDASQSNFQLPKIYLLYHKNMLIWSKYFGRDHIKVRVYNENSNQQDVIPDFCNIVGITDFKNKLRYPQKRMETVNPRLGKAALEIMQMALDIGLKSQARIFLEEVLAETSFRLGNIRKYQTTRYFDREFYHTVFKMYEKDNEKLAKWFPETAGFANWFSDIFENENEFSGTADRNQMIDTLITALLISLEKKIPPVHD